MTDEKKKYEHIVTDIFDTFMKDIGDYLEKDLEDLEHLKEPEKDGDLVDEKEYTDEDEISEDESNDPVTDAMKILDKIVDEVTKQLKKEK